MHWVWGPSASTTECWLYGGGGGGGDSSRDRGGSTGKSFSLWCAGSPVRYAVFDVFCCCVVLLDGSAAAISAAVCGSCRELFSYYQSFETTYEVVIGCALLSGIIVALNFISSLWCQNGQSSQLSGVIEFYVWLPVVCLGCMLPLLRNVYNAVVVGWYLSGFGQLFVSTASHAAHWTRTINACVAAGTGTLTAGDVAAISGRTGSDELSILSAMSGGGGGGGGDGASIYRVVVLDVIFAMIPAVIFVFVFTPLGLWCRRNYLTNKQQQKIT